MTLNEKPFLETLMESLTKINVLLSEANSIADNVRNSRGIRSALFSTSPTGHRLVDETSSLAKSLDECKELIMKTVRYADETAVQLLSESLDAALNENRKSACILAPMFDDNNVRDGYFRRIQNVDGLLPNECFRIYLNFEPAALVTTAKRYDDKHICITYGRVGDVESVFNLLADRVSIIYCHSIHRFDERFLSACHSDLPFILDFHGVVPEELEYSGEQEDVVADFNQRERSAVKRADCIVSVSKSMESHIRQKYPEQTAGTDFITMPIVDVNRTEAIDTTTLPNKRPIAIYAGGIQKWQLIDTMFDAIEQEGGTLFDYRIFIPEPEQFNQIWSARKKPRNIEVSTRTPQELVDEYRRCQYGFILRDDCIVNNVACPTKLTEYLENGVVPIVSTPNIGDFANRGMAYVTLDDFIAGSIPNPDALAEMVSNNCRVFEAIVNEFSEGRSAIQGIFATRCS